MITIYLLIIIFILIILMVAFLIFYREPFVNTNNIPKIIYLSYKTKDIPEYVMKKWNEIYPDYEVKLYDNTDCINFLKTEYNDEYVDIFNYIKDGPIKADFWRVCILYKYGGIYSDIDIEPLINIEKIMLPDTTFITCLSAMGKKINPHFIVAEPKHKVLKMCMDKYLEMYRDKKKYTYWGWSIVHIMTAVLRDVFDKYITKDGVYYDNHTNNHTDNHSDKDTKKSNDLGDKYQFLKEVLTWPKSFFDLKGLWMRLTNTGRELYCKYNNIKVLNNKYDGYLDHEFK
jgi:mannosyltransferase OCH1-like enzyme